MNLKLAILLTAMLTLSACTATKGHRMLTGYLDSGIGTLTFEDVVKRWHSPDEVIEGKETITGIWIQEDYVTVRTMFGEKKTLIFDRETGLLKSYDIEYYSD